jgi:hypothetical protein
MNKMDEKEIFKQLLQAKCLNEKRIFFEGEIKW